MCFFLRLTVRVVVFVFAVPPRGVKVTATETRSLRDLRNAFLALALGVIVSVTEPGEVLVAVPMP